MRKNPKEAVSQYIWEKLKQAHTDMRQARVADAMQVYAQVLPKFWEYTTEPNNRWRRTGVSIDYPSSNWASAYLREYFYLKQTWFGWRHFTSEFLETNDRSQIPFLCQSQLISTLGWASIRKQSLSQVISKQEDFLRDVRWRQDSTESDFLKSMHFMVLSYAHTLAFHQSKAFDYAYRSIALLNPKIEPYYAIRAYDLLGTAFYTFRQYDQALDCYTKSAEIVQSIGQSARPLMQYYGDGWAYIGNRQLDNALEAFRRGYHLKAEFSLYYDAARCKYGEGYTHFLLGNYDEAVLSLYEALCVFCDDHFDLNTANDENSMVSPAMTAACSHVLALVYERRGEIREAIRYETQAVDWQRTIEDPGQLSDMLRRAIKLNRQSKRFSATIRYLMQFLLLRLRYRVPMMSF